MHIDLKFIDDTMHCDKLCKIEKTKMQKIRQTL